MYQNDISLSLTILGLFLVANVIGASLNKNQTTISKEATASSDHPNYGELENSLSHAMDLCLVLLCDQNGFGLNKLIWT